MFVFNEKVMSNRRTHISHVRILNGGQERKIQAVETLYING
jgi:hypothetical protein